MGSVKFVCYFLSKVYGMSAERKPPCLVLAAAHWVLLCLLEMSPSPETPGRGQRREDSQLKDRADRRENGRAGKAIAEQTWVGDS